MLTLDGIGRSPVAVRVEDAPTRSAASSEVPLIYRDGAPIACDAQFFDTNGSAPGGTCAPILASCIDIQKTYPNAPGGTYLIDPEGPGKGSARIFVSCAMAPKVGG